MMHIAVCQCYLMHLLSFNKPLNTGTGFDKLPHERVELGWYPFPKSEMPLFYNNLLPRYYESTFKYKCHPDTLRKSFVKEFNTNILSQCDQLLGEVKCTIQSLEVQREKYTSVYSRMKKHGRSEDGFLRKKVAHGKKKAVKRKLKRCKEKLRSNEDHQCALPTENT